MSQTEPPRTDPLALDPLALDAYLRALVPDHAGPLSISRCQGGQSNPTYRVATPSRCYALRRKPPGTLLPSAHAVDREYRVLAALAGTGVPVPKVFLYCDDSTVIGSPFYLMDWIDGRVFWDATLPDCAPPERAAIYDAANAALAALHDVDWRQAGLADFGRPGNYFSRQISRWSKQYVASTTRSIEGMDRLMAWLPANLPPDDETTIVHGDFRLDNMIFAHHEPRVLAILDWELSTLGHPLADLAYFCMTWHLSPALFRGLAGTDYRAAGIPDEKDFIAAYCRRTGRRDIEHWPFYLAYNFFRLAAILQGVSARALQGNAVGDEARRMGDKVAPIAAIAWDHVNRS